MTNFWSMKVAHAKLIVILSRQPWNLVPVSASMTLFKRVILFYRRYGTQSRCSTCPEGFPALLGCAWKSAWGSQRMHSTSEAQFQENRVWLTPKFISVLEKMQVRYEELCGQLSGSSTLSPKALTDLNRELAEIEPIMVLADDLKKKNKEIANLGTVLDEATDDPDLMDMAAAEKEELVAQIPGLEEKLVLELLPKDEDDNRPAIVEVRAGVGGDEGALFALDLFNMYWKYAMTYRWKIELLALDKEEMGGCKEAAMAIVGDGAYGKLKFESGVHRVQRNPKTEVADRIHTSTASVVVFPKVEEVDVSLKPGDLDIEYTRSRGAGGQHVNKTESAVRITHKPTGLTVAMQDERSQHSNRKRALGIILAKVYELERSKQRESMSHVRRTAIGSGDRSARIRTYNFPQSRITDHRIGMTEFGIEEMMNGLKLDKFIHALHLEEQVERMETFNAG